ncbi:MAG: hypothetical protein IPM22_06300 [Betaproteobacteria bacterium]|nr:hypothetical protein [Betaproteobacteria bacterium]MCC7215340.1 hypothetical protein [Burkholderiales bacterium]
MELFTVFALALVGIGAGVLAMAIGVMFKRPCLRGSCGGPGVTAPDGGRLSCATCPNRRRDAGAGDAH